MVFDCSDKTVPTEMTRGLQLRSLSTAEQLRIVEKNVGVRQVTPQLVKLEIQLTTVVLC